MLKNIPVFTLVLMLALPAQVPAYANELGYMGYLEQLGRLNAYSPEQSPRHERSEEVLTDRITDSKNAVMGEVRDVILNQQGAITMLDVELDRLKMGSDRMTLDYTAMAIEPAGNGYKLGLDKGQIVELFPTLLANIPTASGGDDMISTQNLIGKTVKSESGRKIGLVEDVLFDQLGGKAELLFVSMKYSGLRGQGVAIPFNAARYDANGKYITVTVNDDMAKAMRDVAKD